MKKLFVLVLLTFVPVSSFAIVNFDGYAGYNFLGKFDPKEQTGPVSGVTFGGRAHLTIDFLLLTVGLGAFTDYRFLTYDNNNNQTKFDRFSAGPDIFLKLDPMLIPIKPYVRGGMSMYDRYQTEVLNSTTTDKEYFNGYYFGIGASWTLISLLLIDVQMFGEYLYDTAGLTHDRKLNSHRVNLGLTLAM